MITSVQTRPAVQDQNKSAFYQFKNAIRFPIKFETGDLLVKVKLTCYRQQEIVHCTGTIILIDHGDNTGNIGVTSDFPLDEAESFYRMIQINNAQYSSGRAKEVLCIEQGSERDLGSFTRIDIEERVNDFIIWNN